MVSEMLVDWLKHAFITKFNHIRPSVYERYTDVLCRDLASGSAVGRHGARKVRIILLPLLYSYECQPIPAFLCGPVTARCASSGLRLPAFSGARDPRRLTVGEPAFCGTQRWVGVPGSNRAHE
jgi:hypothetical protein